MRPEPLARRLSDEVINLIIEHGNRMESRLSRIVIQFFGGAAGRVGPADTAFAQRQAEYNVGIETQWTDAAESEKHIGWTDTLSDALKPHSSNGYLVNFLGTKAESWSGRRLGAITNAWSNSRPSTIQRTCLA
jgi:hypothetical protein